MSYLEKLCAITGMKVGSLHLRFQALWAIPLKSPVN